MHATLPLLCPPVSQRSKKYRFDLFPFVIIYKIREKHTRYKQRKQIIESSEIQRDKKTVVQEIYWYMPLLDVSAKSKGQPVELMTTSKVLEGVNHFLIKRCCKNIPHFAKDWSMRSEQ